MFMRLAFSVATHVDPDILLIDEILAVGDEHFSHKSFAKMTEFKQRGKTIVYVTHDLNAVQRWCDLAAWVDGGTIRAMGDPDYVTNLYRQEVARSELKQDAAPVSVIEAVRASPVAPSFGPKVEPERRWGNYKVELEGVRLLDAAGQPATVLDPESSLDLCFDFRAKEPVEDVTFSLGIYREDGAQVFGTTSALEKVPLPKPLPEQGTLRFRISRLGLLDGNYHLDVAAHSRDGVDYDFHKRLYSFSVRAKMRDLGMFRPPHEWVLEQAPASKEKATG
jgi:lipopolysaccharide transport system ATP-binding protein